MPDLAAWAKPRAWQTIFAGRTAFSSAQAGGVYTLYQGGAVAFGAVNNIFGADSIDPNDFTGPGGAPLFRLVLSLVPNTVAPAQTISGILYRVTGGGGGGGQNISAMAQVTANGPQQPAIANPPAGSVQSSPGTPFTLSQAGVYVPAVFLDQAAAAGASTFAVVELQVRPTN